MFFICNLNLVASPNFAERLQQTYGTAPKTDKPRTLIGPSGNLNAHYGWREAQAVQSPTPQMAHVGARELTPERIIRGLSGLSVFPEDEFTADEPTDKPLSKNFAVQIPTPPDPEHVVFKSGRRQQANRREIISHQRDRGGRSPQNQGRRP